MPPTVCVGSYTLRYLDGGAYAWAFLNWALGLKALGCQVIWLDSVEETTPAGETLRLAAELRHRLEPHDLAGRVVIVRRDGAFVSAPGCLPPEAMEDVALFVDLGYDLSPSILGRFRRTAFVDIDPGLTQLWVSQGQLRIAPHDVYLTYGETVGAKGSLVPDCGMRWVYTPPPVYLPAWDVGRPADGAFTTISNWWGDPDWIELDGRVVDNSKRTAFLEYLHVPESTSATLELSLPVSPADDVENDLGRLAAHGWSVRHARDTCGTASAFRAYVRDSLGEFGCMKPGYRLLRTAWTSERTLNYLAAGRPAVIQDTGRSRFLPDDAGLLRFSTPQQAARRLDEVLRDYELHSRAARAIAEEHFDSARVLARVLDLALR